MIIQGTHGVFVVIDLQKKIPSNSKFYPSRDWRSKNASKSKIKSTGKSLECLKDDWPRKRKRTLSTGSNGDMSISSKDANFVICLRYNAMLFLDFLGSNEMIVVEKPWAPIFESLPDPLVSKTFALA